MSRTDELERCERRLRDLVPRWSDPEFRVPPEAHLDESVTSELAYAQMQLERHLAETHPVEREAERIRLELTMPAFTALFRWYDRVHSPSRDAEEDGSPDRSQRPPPSGLAQ